MSVALPAGMLRAQWPSAPADRRVHGLTTLRRPLGASPPPYDLFNLGLAAAGDGDDPLRVEANRAVLVEVFALPGPPCWLEQVHGTAVVRDPEDTRPRADAAVTAEPGRVLAVLSADCLPVLLRAQDGSEVGVAHAGWRGLAAGVLEATVAAMRTAPDRLQAWLGPAAGPRHYEVDALVRDAFVGTDTGADAAFVASRPGHWHADLFALARRRLRRAGLPADAIAGGGCCTISDPQRFYSHRRDGRTGRMASLAWIAAPARGPASS